MVRLVVKPVVAPERVELRTAAAGSSALGRQVRANQRARSCARLVGDVGEMLGDGRLPDQRLSPVVDVDIARDAVGWLLDAAGSGLIGHYTVGRIQALRRRRADDEPPPADRVQAARDAVNRLWPGALPDVTEPALDDLLLGQRRLGFLHGRWYYRVVLEPDLTPSSVSRRAATVPTG